MDHTRKKKAAPVRSDPPPSLHLSDEFDSSDDAMSSLLLTPTSCATDGFRDKTPINSPQAPPRTSAPLPAMVSSSIRSSSEKPIRILLLGTFQAGKSSFIFDAMDFSKGRTSTSKPDTHTIIPTSYAIKIDGKTVHLIDTPGFGGWDADNTRILKIIGDYLRDNGGMELNGVIFMFPITDENFTDYEANIFEMLVQAVGPHNVDQIMIVTTKWDNVVLRNADSAHRRVNNLRYKYWRGLESLGVGFMKFKINEKYMDESIKVNPVYEILSPLVGKPAFHLRLREEMKFRRYKTSR